MKKILAVLLTLTMLLTFSVGTAGAKQVASKGHGNGWGQVKKFSDIKGHWAEKVIERMQSRGIANGYEDGTFRPNNLITQAEVTVLIDRAVSKKLNIPTADEEEDDDDRDDDRNVPKWAKKAVKRAAKKNLINLNRFNSHVQVSRLESCIRLAKFLESYGKIKPVSVSELGFNPFKDSWLIPADDYRYILALYQMGIIRGNPDGTFNPNSAIKRVEIFIIISALDDDEVSDDEEAPTWDDDSEIRATKVSANSVELEWDAAEDNEKVTGYKIIYTDDGEEKVKTVSGLTAKITGLDADEEYEFTVEARDAAGNWSTDGPSVEVITKETDDDTAAPTWPSGSDLDAEDITDTSLTLEWTEAEDDVGVTGYRVYVYQDGELKKTFNTAENEMEIKDLTADTKYTFKVRARDAAGNWSSYLSTDATTEEEAEDTAAPTWPSGSDLDAKDITDTSLTLEWTEAEDNVGVTGYRVYVYQDGDLKNTFNTAENEMEIKDLTADTEYTFKVRARDAAGNWSSSLSVDATTEEAEDTAAPTWPSGSELEAVTVTTTSITLEWPDAVDNVGVTAYKVYQDGVLKQTLEADENETTISGLNADTEYTFKVKAGDAAGNWSSYLSKTVSTN